MPIHLDALEQRIVGVLIEKELTVPDTYPLTANALVAGCNQKSNREPLMAVEDYDVEGALRALMDKAWVTRREAHGGRALRYAHELRTQLAVGEAELALLSELLCRGPQAPGELKTRASRMHPLGSPAEVEGLLRDMAARPVPYVRLLERQPRERQARWTHLLGGDVAEGDGPPAPRSTALPTPASPAPTQPTPAPARDPGDDERLERLEERLADLEARLDRLEGR